MEMIQRVEQGLYNSRSHRISSESSNEFSRLRPTTRRVDKPEDNVEWDEAQEAEARKKVTANSEQLVDSQKQELYETDANRFWDDFYSIHQNRFFKDRHWLFTEFPELLGKNPDPKLTSRRTSEKSGNCEHSTSSSGKVDESIGISEASSFSGSSANASDKTEDFGVNQALTGSERNSTEEEVISMDSICRESDSKKYTEVQNIETSEVQETEDSKSQDNELGKTIEPQNALDSNKQSGEEGDTSGKSYPGRNSAFRIFEVGCGVGNTVYPVLQTNNDRSLFVYCCDLSETAIQLVKDNEEYASGRCHAFVCDITQDAFPFPDSSLDVITLIFVLSAVHPDKMQETINRLTRCLKPGGRILFRDYGRYDMAQLRFKNGRCLSDNFYVRGDGTRVYFFTQEELRGMFVGAGLVEDQNIVDRRLQVNRGRQLKMYRVWIQCKYRKPELVQGK